MAGHRADWPYFADRFAVTGGRDLNPRPMDYEFDA